jgi:hypothetical protein
MSNIVNLEHLKKYLHCEDDRGFFWIVNTKYFGFLNRHPIDYIEFHTQDADDLHVRVFTNDFFNEFNIVLVDGHETISDPERSLIIIQMDTFLENSVI